MINGTYEVLTELVQIFVYLLKINYFKRNPELGPLLQLTEEERGELHHQHSIGGISDQPHFTVSMR